MVSLKARQISPHSYSLTHSLTHSLANSEHLYILIVHHIHAMASTRQGSEKETKQYFNIYKRGAHPEAGNGPVSTLPI
jgi:hypothetical protein